MKISYETHFKSNREDGRHISSYAALLERLRQTKQTLSLPNDITAEEFYRWKKEVIEKHKELLGMPEFTPQPDPKKLNEIQRDGYRVEKWEFYPDDYTAVPMLILVPDGVTKEMKAPAVICVPGSGTSKEFISGEPLLDAPCCQFQKYPDRNLMALYYAKQGYVALAIDNTGMCECAPANFPREFQMLQVQELSYGYISSGMTYEGMQTFRLMNLIKKLAVFPFIDLENVAVSAHSLGTISVLSAALFCDEIKGVVFNDYLGHTKDHYTCTTEHTAEQIRKESIHHLLPGQFQYFSTPDLCAALAPKPLALDEGGADAYFETVKRGYQLVGAEENLQFVHYPKFQNPEDRKYHGEIPKYGLTMDEYVKGWCYCDVPEHAFKKEPAIAFMKKLFYSC